MNRIFVEDISSNNLHIEEDTILIVKDYKDFINIEIDDSIKLFVFAIFSDFEIKYKTSYDTVFNVFTVDSSLCLDIELYKDNLNFKYNYSTININDNSYEININHLKNNIISNIINHGINTSDNKLSFIINAIVPKDITNINTSQDSKIILLGDNNATIKPNLFIDNDDTNANHAAYIGKFKEDEIFYLMSRGLTRDDSINLLIKSFLINNMDLSYEERELILYNIKKYWR